MLPTSSSASELDDTADSSWDETSDKSGDCENPCESDDTCGQVQSFCRDTTSTAKPAEIAQPWRTPDATTSTRTTASSWEVSPTVSTRNRTTTNCTNQNTLNWTSERSRSFLRSLCKRVSGIYEPMNVLFVKVILTVRNSSGGSPTSNRAPAA